MMKIFLLYKILQFKVSDFGTSKLTITNSKLNENPVVNCIISNFRSHCVHEINIIINRIRFISDENDPRYLV